MNKRIMEQIAELTEADGGKTLQSFRYSLDSQGGPTANYDDTPEEVIWNVLGKDNNSKILDNFSFILSNCLLLM